MSPAATSPPATVFREFLDSGRLGFQICASCEQSVFYPRVLCPHCGGQDLRWRESAGTGTVYSTTTVCRRNETYNVALVDLDEGFRMMTRVEDTPPEDVRIGMRVLLQVRHDPDRSEPVAVFVPAEA
ncbi:hypothetical protein F4561_001714 [Lipingzhangella halophila]|uniref:DNA-binding protein n=1 Tax=Lipingzhangella halophila TaxID=1783352 RepID=A0A7W7RFB8_9ACTN|nr:OB-fold domain-containing protein [Lipingzhangella halophila]MBB4930894.1 hypothetical protein [Lipingzhangella halophila]